MGQKTVRFSDLSGQLITDDHAPVQIVVREHPDLAAGPVQIEALTDEAAAIQKAAQPVAVVDLYVPGEDEPRRIAVDAAAFDALATEKPMAEVLAAAAPAKRNSRPGAAGAGNSGRTSYATLEHAGTPHKGKITEAERRLVRENLEEVNARLAAQGLRTISLADPAHVERYGLQQLATASASPK
jgi:hypothetical protein